jgi:hypothetical protein
MRTRWPWITVLAAAVAIFNPLGFEIIGSAIRYSPTDWLRDLWVIVTLAGVAIIIGLALIEWFVRGRLNVRAAARAGTEILS